MSHLQGDVGYPGLPGGLGSQGQEVCTCTFNTILVALYNLFHW